MLKSPHEYVDGVLNRDRLMLARTITLIESTLPAHQELARTIVDLLLPHTGKGFRIGITGVPGAGKSTYIESFGNMLTELGHRVAVLAIDPSSSRSGGSILGDKTRMERLAVNANAFIRPSPSSGTLGGVGRKTRETMLVCEAAGYDVVIIETVGVGQSETTVASMVDFFLVLMIAGAGDELQGIKKGVLEVADAIVINKADGDNILRAEIARKEYQTALHMLMPNSPNWSPPVLTCSSLEHTGIGKIWETILDHRKKLSDSGEMSKKRKHQALDWMAFLLEDGLRQWFYSDPQVKAALPGLRAEVENEKTSPTAAADTLLRFLQVNNR
ncbi:methylmalonyl Co-A mutase-associated GTPase MeaB [Desulfopila sp. IMCC35006]|uniref:methylmalonyl Co-A mutase-associated GTPase MeaB n=1 Tax=Desulfopila sp. IMCC35006 TaxID=2569542 RepID=UPI0010AD9823|nr:methylmalonyl Co-A mutase-associated GTPase MeaB [Desulfopila sp. IMCC35006]TKB28137.1 methylmalonyl Co-A mutase-associated GTPase MeaB [Desulfopila sp. IMCC35006]